MSNRNRPIESEMRTVSAFTVRSELPLSRIRNQRAEPRLPTISTSIAITRILISSTIACSRVYSSASGLSIERPAETGGLAMPFSFRPSLAPTLAAVLGVVITALLGNWQLNRAAEKARLQERIEQAGRHAPIHLGAAQLDLAEVVYFQVEATGQFKRDATVYIDNRVRNGIAGYEIITPLRVEGSA